MSKVAVISSNTAWSIRNFRLGLARSLKKAGYRVVLVSSRDKHSKDLEGEFEFHEIFINNKGTNPIEDLRTIFEYFKIYKKLTPDVVFGFTIKPNVYGNITCCFFRIKTVVNTITGLGTLFIKPNLATRIAKVLYKLSLGKSTKVFFQNMDDFRLFIDEGMVREGKCDALPGSGVNVQKFKPVKGCRGKTFKFLLIARMLWDKGVGEYVEAARVIKRKYRNVEFLLLGSVGVNNPSAIPKEKIVEWEKEGIVKYLGSTDDVRMEMAKADCIVLPSYREGIPRVLLEAAAMEKPIITTNTAGCREVVIDGVNGFLCKVKDPIDLSIKMEKIINMPNGKRRCMGKVGRKLVSKKFDERIVISKYLKTIKTISK